MFFCYMTACVKAITFVEMLARLTDLPLGKNGHHFAEDIFKCNFLNEKFGILIRIDGPIDNKWTLVQVMAWRRIGDKSLPEPMLIQFTYASMRH